MRAALALILAALAVPGAAQAQFDVPLDPGSPWPKFRRDSTQSGRSPVQPTRRGGARWRVRTRGGIFSSPVIGADGTVYVGSADRRFYAIAPSGRTRWSVETGEIIDSAALLDDQGKVYVPSADGFLYALEAATGREVWRFAAAPPESTGAFISWFEGNVAIGPDGTLYAPNDNFRLYAVDRATGAERAAFTTLDQTWSLPAVDARTGELFVGNNFFLGGQPNVFGLPTALEPPLWGAQVNGSVVASPLLTADGLVVVGGFDGYVHAYDRATGAERWRFATRGHIYASPAQLSDGTIVQASTDGSIYGLDPENGRARWQYDTPTPIRSSPAVDGVDNVYVGTGDGHLLVLDDTGHRRWELQLGPTTINASPALGRNAIVLADSEGSIFSVPSEYCLRPQGGRDSACEVGSEPSAGIPRGASLSRIRSDGQVAGRFEDQIEAGDPLAFQLAVRRRGRVIPALIDERSVEVETTPRQRTRVTVSGDRRYLVVEPRGTWTRDFDLRITGRSLVGPRRTGLAFSGGRPGPRFEWDDFFTVDRGDAGDRFPLPVPRRPGDPAGIWRLNKLALPLPDLLPSYNQIGFERLEFLVGLAAPGRRADEAVAWLVGAKVGPGGAIVPDPATTYLVPFTARVQDGTLTLDDPGGATFVLNGFGIETTDWRVTRNLDRPDRAGKVATTLEIDCAKIGFYGPFLEQLGLCSQATPMKIFGEADMRPQGRGVQRAPEGVGTVAFARDGDALVATLTGSQLRPDTHAVSILAQDARSGRPLPLPYGTETTRTTNPDGTLATVRVPLRGAAGALRATLMVDAYPAASGGA